MEHMEWQMLRSRYPAFLAAFSCEFAFLTWLIRLSPSAFSTPELGYLYFGNDGNIVQPSDYSSKHDEGEYENCQRSAIKWKVINDIFTTTSCLQSFNETMSKILTVIGGTGIQGSSVILAALESSEQWQVRAITRDPTGQAAQALQAKGVEIVQADLNESSSLTKAFANSYAIFAATDFFGPFAALGADAEKAMEVEWNQTNNIIQAALACKSLRHFVWSTLPHAANTSNGKFKIGHFEAKNRGEDLIRSIPSLLAKTTFAYVGWYASNFVYPTFMPTILVCHVA
jgi:hypothetical protein